ncbi:MAG: serine hydrolase [Ekhidna sp.]|nr:serine hydrolase [Ekhidna sp.]
MKLIIKYSQGKPNPLWTFYLIFVLLGCNDESELPNKSDNSDVPDQPESPIENDLSYSYDMPIYKGDGWSVANVEDVQIDRNQLELAVSKIVDRDFVNISSLLIARDGQLVVDELFRTTLDANDAAVGNTDLNVHTLQSTTKSFVSAITGIAIDQGYIESVNTSFYSLFPEYDSFENWIDSKNNITVEDVLTMRHGWQYNEWDYPIQSDLNTLHFIYRNYYDFVKGLLDRPMEIAPGTSFVYSTMASHALGAAVSNTSQKTIPDFAQEYLFGPLQFQKSYWLFSPKNRAMTGCCLFISGRDMTKLGQLYLDKGEWNGSQIISSDWIERSIAKALSLNLGFTNGYGYHWWRNTFTVNERSIDSYFAAGNGGQFIYVFPSLNAVVSFTGENYGSPTMYQVTSFLENHLLPAFE